MKRVMLLIGTNLAIMVVLGIVSTLTGAHRFFTGTGLDLGKLLFFAGLMGFGGAFISLWMSKTIAKWSTGAQVIVAPEVSSSAVFSAGIPQAPIGVNCGPFGPEVGHADSNPGHSVVPWAPIMPPRSGTEITRT